MSAGVTLRDVARLAGVSTKTVSRVVNGQGEIREATRQRVLEAIQQLGYHPNVLARSLVRGHTNTLGVVTWGLIYRGASAALTGIQEEADRLGYSVLLSLFSRQGDTDPHRVLGDLVARRVDGIIWAVAEIGDNRAWAVPEYLEQIPPVVFLGLDSHGGACAVDVDHYAGATLAVKHLIAQGRRRIGLIAGPHDWKAHWARRNAWRDCLLEAGLAAKPSLVAEGDWSAAGGERAMRQLLEEHPTLDAVFASNDQMALGALSAAHRLGRRVPQDLAVVGFDDIPESAYFYPSLTTVSRRNTESGHTATQLLHRRIEARRHGESDDAPEVTLLTPELKVRESSVVR